MSLLDEVFKRDIDDSSVQPKTGKRGELRKGITAEGFEERRFLTEPTIQLTE
jgi:hypothetical protein